MTYLKKADVFKAWDDWDLTRAGDYKAYIYEHFDVVKRSRMDNRLNTLFSEWQGDPFRFGQPDALDPFAPLPDEAADEYEAGGYMESPDQRRQQATGKTFVFTCAQSNTELVPQAWWDTLLKLVEVYDAELHISQFTYNKAAYGAASVKVGSKKATDKQPLWFDPRMKEYISNEDIQITDDLVWCGSLNLSPTAVNPISGFQNHVRQASGILPHTKIAMESVATLQCEPTRFMYTTGCITQRNYIQKAAGQKADFHHVFGALLVEVSECGKYWWARQLNFNSEGGLFDKTNMFRNGEHHKNGVRVQAITHGDIHGYKMDEEIIASVFGSGGMLDRLKPKEQFFEDIIDFMPRNHHNIKDFQFIHSMRDQGYESVEAEFEFMAEWLMRDAYRDWCQSFVVVSNHDQAVKTWLKDRGALDDPANLVFWLEQNLELAKNHKRHSFVEIMQQWCYNFTGGLLYDHRMPVFLKEDDSYKILKVIEAAMHGHQGANGSRGSPKGLRVIGKSNTGHTHSCGIVEGVYTAGLLGKLDQEYNSGPSSWSHSSVVTYGDAKRAIYTHNSKGWWRP